jgi:hypothetical protein
MATYHGLGQVGPDEIKKNVYYMPAARNQVAFDSFIVANGKLFIFQFMIASEHPIKQGILTFFSQYLQLPAKVNWYFVFVIPLGPNPEVTCPQPQEAGLTEMKLFSAVTDPKEITWSLYHLYVH